MKYDLVVSNFPFQSTNEGERNIGAPLWPQFISRSMDFLNDGGTLACITPATWMNRAKGGAWKTISQYDLLSVNPNVKEYFPNVGGGGGTFSAMTLKKQPYGGKTIIGDAEIDFHNDIIPSNNKLMNKENLKLLGELLERKLDMDVHTGPSHPSINSNNYSHKQTRKHQYETYYSGHPERRSMWCDEPIGHYGEWKLVVANSGAFYKSLEITDKGVGRQSNYVLGTKKELKRIKKLLLSDDSKRLCELMMEGNFNNALECICNEV